MRPQLGSAAACPGPGRTAPPRPGWRWRTAIVACTISTLAMLGSTWSRRDAPRPRAGGARGQHVLARPHRIGRGARDAREHRDVEDADGDDAGDQPRPVDRAEHDGRQQRREGEGEVGQRASPPSSTQPRRAEASAAERPRPDPGRCRTATTPTTIEVRAPDQQLRGDVAAEAVGAEPVRGARGAAACSGCRSRSAATASTPATAARCRRTARVSSAAEHEARVAPRARPEACDQASLALQPRVDHAHRARRRRS